MSLTATSVPETLGASDYLPTAGPSAAPSGGSTSPSTGGSPAAEAGSGHDVQTAAPRARSEGVVTPVDEGDGAPDMGPHRPTGSKHPVSTRPVGAGEALLAPATVPQGPEVNTALATSAGRQPPEAPLARRGGKDVVARCAPEAGPRPTSPVPRQATPRDEASSSQAGRDAAATIAAVGGPAMEAVAAQARKPPPGISLRRSKAELQAVLEAEPYPGPFPTHRPAWEVPNQASLGDGERPTGAPLRVRIGDLYPGKYDELVRHRPDSIARPGAGTPSPTRPHPPPRPPRSTLATGPPMDTRSLTAGPPDQALARGGQAGQDALLQRRGLDGPPAPE